MPKPLCIDDNERFSVYLLDTHTIKNHEGNWCQEVVTATVFKANGAVFLVRMDSFGHVEEFDLGLSEFRNMLIGFAVARQDEGVDEYVGQLARTA